MEDGRSARQSRIAFEYRGFVFHDRGRDLGLFTWMERRNAHPLNEVSCPFNVNFSDSGREFELPNDPSSCFRADSPFQMYEQKIEIQT
jgi:hypothetical protein